MDNIISDLGGQEHLNGGQRLLLETLRAKLIVVLQISDYIDKQSEIIKEGELIPVLSRNYLAYFNSIRLTLAELYKHWDGSRPAKTLEQYLAEGKAENENPKSETRK
jgi:hypothetical protein